jgi:hypothetical protein
VIAEYFPATLTPDVAPQAVDLAPGLVVERRPHTPASLLRLATGLRERAAGFRELPAEDVLRALSEVHLRWEAPASPERAEAARLIHRVTGYPEFVIDASLRRLFAGMTRHALKDWLHRAGIHPVMLNQPAPESPLRTWVYGPKLTTVISSGNIPGAALPSLVQALLLKSPCLVKTAAAEPFLLPLYAQSLAEHGPELAKFLAVTHWEGGAEALETALLPEVEALVVYGSDETVQSLRRRLPVRARFVGYGHRISFTAISRELLVQEETARETARRAVHDLCVFDQQGCYSPQAIYVEGGGKISPAVFAELLADALADAARDLPRRPISVTEAASIHQFRVQTEMRGFREPETCLWASEKGTAWTVALRPAAPLGPCVLNRTAVVQPLDDLDDLPRLLAGREQYLLSAVLGAPEARFLELAATLAGAGICRVARLGQAQAPESPLFHDGVHALAQLARYVTVDSPFEVDPREGYLPP